VAAPRLTPAALAVVLATSLLPGPMRAQDPVRQAVRHEEGIVQVVVDRLPHLTVVVLLDSAGSLLLPVQATLQHLGYSAVFSAGRLELPAPDGRVVVLDVRAGTISTGADTVRLAPAELAEGPDGVYLRSGRLAAMLDADVAFSPATLSASFARRVPFPAQQRIIADQRRAMLLAQQRHALAEINDTVAYPLVTGAGVLDWELATMGIDPSSNSTARVRGAVAALGGDLAAGVSLHSGAAARDVTLRYHRVFPHGRAITQARAGSIITGGMFARFIRGVEFTNRPFLQDQERGEVVLRPDLPAGWEYEVFQGNQLLGYSEAGTRDGISIPLRTGTTPVQVRLLGPAGEEVLTTLLYQTPVSLLGRGRFEYAAAAGRCDGPACTRYAHADARFGATSLLTVGGGLEHVADSSAAGTRAYAVASFTTGTRWTGELQLMPRALYAGDGAFHPRDGSVVRFRASRSRPGFGPVSVTPSSLARWDAEATWDERLQPGTALGGRVLPLSSVRLGTAVAGSGPRGLERWRVSAATAHHRGWGELRYELERHVPRPHTLSGRGSLVVPVTWAGETRRPMLTAAAGLGSVGLRLLEAGASIQPRGRHVVSAGASWTRETRRPAFSLGWTARVGVVHTNVRAAAGRTGAATAASVSGSSAFSHDGQVVTRPGTLTGYGGIHGVVFIDHDGDGVFSDGDEPVPGVALVAGGYPVTADSRGRYVVWGLQPYSVATVAVDSARIPDPAWTTAVPVLRVRPAPNAARRVDIALVRTRELLGAVIAEDGIAAAGGVTLLIHRLAAGSDGETLPDAASVLTFSDGQFYVSRLRPGSYRIEVAPSSLAALGARAHPAAIDFIVPATGDDPFIELPPIRLLPRS
jgi:hypothetical protein